MKYSPEFKKMVLAEIQNNKSYSEISRKYGVSLKRLRDWRREAGEPKLDGFSKKELRQFRRRSSRGS